MASSGKLTWGRRVFAFLAVAVLAGCGQRGLERLARGETGKVVSVHSGDSFTLDSGLEVRLAGVETPRGDQPFADQARTALTLLVVGRKVQLLYGGARRDGCVAMLSPFLGRSRRDISTSSTPMTMRSVMASTMLRFASKSI